MKRKIIAALAFVTIMTGLGVIGTTSPASASAYGCSLWNTKVVGGVPLASGQFCVLVEGSGTYVSTVGGGWASARSVANPCLIVNAWDRNGVRYYGTHSCRSGYINGGTIKVGVYRQMKVGTICGSLYQNGGHVVSHCHRIQ